MVSLPRSRGKTQLKDKKEVNKQRHPCRRQEQLG
jgi:hypothetical protein